MTDDNMDLNSASFNSRYKIGNIKNMTLDFLTQNDLTIHNDKQTFHRQTDDKSCIDHIISNIPSKLTHITTTDKGYSDHSILTATYHTKTPLTRQKLIKTRPSYLLTAHLLNSYIDCNDILQTIFTYTCPNLIANILMTEINGIINILFSFL